MTGILGAARSPGAMRSVRFFSVCCCSWRYLSALLREKEFVTSPAAVFRASGMVGRWPLWVLVCCAGLVIGSNAMAMLVIGCSCALRFFWGEMAALTSTNADG